MRTSRAKSTSEIVKAPSEIMKKMATPHLMLELKERGYKRHNNEKSHRNAGDHRPEDRPVQHRRPPHEAWQIDLSRDRTVS